MCPQHIEAWRCHRQAFATVNRLVNVFLFWQPLWFAKSASKFFFLSTIWSPPLKKTFYIMVFTTLWPENQPVALFLFATTFLIVKVRSDYFSGVLAIYGLTTFFRILYTVRPSPFIYHEYRSAVPCRKTPPCETKAKATLRASWVATPDVGVGLFEGIPVLTSQGRCSIQPVFNPLWDLWLCSWVQEMLC